VEHSRKKLHESTERVGGGGIVDGWKDTIGGRKRAQRKEVGMVVQEKKVLFRGGQSRQKKGKEKGYGPQFVV